MNKMQNKPSRTAKRAARIGGFSVLICAIVLCITIILNLIALNIPAEYTIFDVSGSGLSEVSAKTEDFVSKLDQDITIYWLCEDGVPDDTMSYLLGTYGELTDRIRLEIIDPIANPNFTSKYSSSGLSNYSLIVESAKRFKILDPSEFYYYTNDFVDQQLNGGNTAKLSQSEYDSLYQSYSQYMDQYATYYYFQGEALITSAIDYVTLPTIPHTYVITGHGESKMSDSLLSTLDVYQMAPEDLNLQTAESVPEDASCIILFAPETDLSPNETQLLSGYIQSGGSLLLVTSPACVNFENLASITALFGLSAQSGMVVDSTSGYYYKQPYQVVPMVNTNISPMYTIYSAGYYAYMPKAHGIAIAAQADMPEMASATPLMATSDKGYRISTDGYDTKLCDPTTQYVGAFGVLSCTDANGIATEGKITWFASSEAFTDAAANEFSGSNYFYMTMMTRYMSNLYVSPYGEIQGVNLTMPTLDDMTINTAIAIGIFVVVVIPASLLTTGLVIWIKRRNR